MLAKRLVQRSAQCVRAAIPSRVSAPFSTSRDEESVRTHTLIDVEYPAFWKAPTKVCPSEDPYSAPEFHEYSFVNYEHIKEVKNWSVPLRHKLSCFETYDVPMESGIHRIVDWAPRKKARIDIKGADLDPIFTPYQKAIFLRLVGRRYLAHKDLIVLTSRTLPTLTANENRVYQYLNELVSRTLSIDAKFSADHDAVLAERKAYDEAIAQTRAQIEESKAAAVE